MLSIVLTLMMGNVFRIASNGKLWYYGNPRKSAEHEGNEEQERG